MHLKKEVEETNQASGQELFESRGGRPGLPVTNSSILKVFVDVKQHLQKKTSQEKTLTYEAGRSVE